MRYRIVRACVPLIPLLLPALPALALDYSLHYTVRDEIIQVSLCGAEAAAQRRFLVDPGAGANLRDVRRRSGGPLVAEGDAWLAPDWSADDCLDYRADLGRIADRRREDVGWRIAAPGGDSDLVTSPQQWLLDTAHPGDATVRLDLPSGYVWSAPWRHDGDGRYRIPPSPRDWAANLAVGRFPRRDLRLGGDALQLALPGVRDAATADRLAQWLAAVGRAARSAYGRLPQAQVQVLALPVGRGGGAVRFGQSSRGQGHGLLLLIDPSRPLAEFRDDWTAVHEFAHLFHPYLGDGGRWLGEGLATYWQEVLRARAGLLAPTQAWARLAAGFARGRRETRGDLSLAQASDRMLRERAFQRVYWTGAAWWLQADVALRRRSGGRLGVADALLRFRDCCLAEAREWSPQDFVARLDALLGVDEFLTRYRAAAARTDFPDLAPTWTALGIRVTDDGSLHFAADAAAADLRVDIMGGAP